MDTALYFPYINVPEEPWFAQVILYWDGAASIIPASIRRDRLQIGDYMAELLNEDLLRSVLPEEVLGYQFATFSDGFLALLEIHRPLGSIDSGQAQLIHSEKMSRSVYQDLEQRGLARELRDSGGWWMVELSTAALYMGYLTGALCGADADLFPVTDSRESLAFLAAPTPDMAARLQALHYEVLSQALPAPSRAVSARELRRFKDLHGDDLRRLRRHLNGQFARIASVEDPDLREATKDGVFQEVEDQIARLREHMSRRDWPRIVSVGFAGVVAAAMATAGAIVTPGSALIHGLDIGSTAIALGPAVAQASDTVRRPRYDRHSPFVYAAAVAQEL